MEYTGGIFNRYLEMELLASAVDDLESVLERSDTDSVDPGKLRNLLKSVSAATLEVSEATTLKNLGLKLWNVSVQLAQKHSSASLLNVKVRSFNLL